MTTLTPGTVVLNDSVVWLVIGSSCCLCLGHQARTYVGAVVDRWRDRAEASDETRYPSARSIWSRVLNDVLKRYIRLMAQQILSEQSSESRNPKSAAARNPLAMGKAMVARQTLPRGLDDGVILGGQEVVTTPKFDEVVDSVTGEVVKLPLHVARNKEWYFSPAGLKTHPPEVKHYEYVRELVRGNYGLTAGELWSMAQEEGFGPCEPIRSYGSFTATLSQCPYVEMRDQDGKVVKGLKHGTAGNSYWPKGHKG